MTGRTLTCGVATAAVICGLLPLTAVASASADVDPPSPPSVTGEVAGGSGELRVRVKGLDYGVRGRVRIKGNGVSRTVRATERVTLPAGRYRVKGLATGSFTSVSGVQQVSVRTGKLAKAKVRYRQVRLRVSVVGLAPSGKSTLAAASPKLLLKRGKKVVKRFSTTTDFYKLKRGTYRVSTQRINGYTVSPPARRASVLSKKANRFQTVKFRFRKVGPSPEPTPTPTPTPEPKPDWNPMSVPPLPVSDDGAGAQPPTYADSVVSSQQGMAVSLRPALLADKAPEQQQYQFSILPLSSTKALWQSQSSTNRIKVPAGVLANGATYRWQAKKVGSDEVYGPYVMQVDTIRTGIQSAQSLAGFQVSLASGELQAGVIAAATPTPSGSLSMSLGFLFGQREQEGLPPGWSLAGVAQPWSYIAMQEGGSIDLVSPIGNSIAYVEAPDSGGSTYVPAVPAGWQDTSGQAASIVRNDDGTWTVMAVSGDVGVFGVPDAKGRSYLTSYSSTTSVVPEAEYSDGRLRSVTDPVTGVAVRAYYQGDAECRAVPSGFITPPDGTLCAVVQPSGLTSIYQYLQTKSGQLLLARIVDNPDTVDSKPTVTDFGYDQAGRIVSQRNGLAVNAIAAGMRANDASVLSQVTYDGAGRVASATNPAALSGDSRLLTKVKYDSGVTVVDSPDVAPTAGYLLKVSYEPETMRPSKNTSGNGDKMFLEWDGQSDRISSVTNNYGLKTTSEYNQSGAMTSQTGPWPASDSTTAATPKTTFSYDQDVSGSDPVPMKGFNTTYWANAELLGLPADRSHGPQIEGGTPAKTQWTWLDNPTGGGNDPWGVRMTGALSVDKVGVYNFKVSPHASVWIGNVLCKSSCTLPLNKGLSPFRVDLRVTTGGPASISIEWDKSGSMHPIDMDDVAPTYGLSSVASVRDALSATDPQNKVVIAQFDEPWTGLQTEGWNKASAQVRGATVYEDFDPGAGQLSRVKSSVLPAGNEIRSAYWEVGATAKPPCEGMAETSQGGMPKSFTRSLDPSAGADNSKALTYLTYYDRFGLPTAGVVEGQDGAYCVYRNDVGDIVETRAPALGDTPAMTATQVTNADGNPFLARSLSKIGDTTYTAEVTADLLGRLTKSVDFWGTTEEYTYDEFTGAPVTQKITTASGYESTSKNFYDNDGRLVKVVMDGETMATIERTGPADGKITYANGVELSSRMSATGQLEGSDWVTTDGVRFSYETSTSPAGRLLTESFGFGQDTAEFQYTYDELSRLVHASLDTTLPVKSSDWKYEFSDSATLGTSPKAGLNSNRTRMIIDDSSIIDYGYDMQDRLIETTDPKIGNNIEYNRAGQMTTIGELAVKYDFQGRPFQVADGSSGDTVTFWRSASGLLGKTSKTQAGTVESRYTSAGIVLDGANRPMVRMIGLPGGATLTRDLSGADGDTYSHITARGQAMWTSDADGVKTSTYSLYEPFGEQIVDERKVPVSPYAPDLSWMAGYGVPSDTLGETGVIATGVRLYLPSIGRFTGPDPVAMGSANEQDYANADPINQADPSGAFPFVAQLGLMVVGFVANILIADYTGNAIKKLKWQPKYKGLLAAVIDAGVAAGISMGIYFIEGGGQVGVVDKVYVYGMTFGSMAFGYLTGRATAAAASAVEQVTGTAVKAGTALITNAETAAARTIKTAATAANTEVKALTQLNQVLENGNQLATKVGNGFEACKAPFTATASALSTGWGACTGAYNYLRGNPRPAVVEAVAAESEDEFFDCNVIHETYWDWQFPTRPPVPPVPPPPPEFVIKDL